MVQKILRLPAVLEVTGKSQSTIYADMSAGFFPKPIKIGERAVGWLESDILAWQEARMAQRDGVAA